MSQLQEEYDFSSIDWQGASASIRARKGGVMVERAMGPESVSGLYMPEATRLSMAPWMGVVVSSGDDRYDPGDVVAIRMWDGTARSITMPSYKSKGIVMCLGVWGDAANAGQGSRFDAADSLPAKLVDGQLVPMGRYTIVKRDAPVKHSGMLELVKDYRTNIGTVVQVGPECKDSRVGMRVVYHPFAAVELGVKLRDPDIAVMHEDMFELELVDEG